MPVSLANRLYDRLGPLLPVDGGVGEVVGHDGEIGIERRDALHDGLRAGGVGVLVPDGAEAEIHYAGLASREREQFPCAQSSGRT
jgi:hypothetical protein